MTANFTHSCQHGACKRSSEPNGTNYCRCSCNFDIFLCLWCSRIRQKWKNKYERTFVGQCWPCPKRREKSKGDRRRPNSWRKGKGKNERGGERNADRRRFGKSQNYYERILENVSRNNGKICAFLCFLLFFHTIASNQWLDHSVWEGKPSWRQVSPVVLISLVCSTNL